LQPPTWRTLEELTTDATVDEVVVVTRSLLGKGRVGNRKGGGWMLINVGKVFEEEEVEAGLRLSGESFEDLRRLKSTTSSPPSSFLRLRSTGSTWTKDDFGTVLSGMEPFLFPAPEAR